MAVHLVRHAKAGSRPDWDGDDESRPLVEAGLAQARRIADVLAPLDVERILTSRYARCAQTVEPLAEKLGLRTERDRGLAEEASLSDAWSLVELAAASKRSTVLCSHGNIISPILDRLHRRGLEVVAEEWSCKKGSVWTVEVGADGSLDRLVQTLPQA